MKKFTFKGVLDGFRSTVQPQQKPEQEIQETLRPEHFSLRKVSRTLIYLFLVQFKFRTILLKYLHFLKQVLTLVLTYLKLW